MTSTLRHRPRALLALAAGLACVLSMLAAAPADARPAGAKWPWVIAQTVQSNGKVSMTLEWKKIARSKKYRIDYAPLKGNLGDGEVQKSHHRKSKITKGAGGTFKHATVANLTAGKVYCFQVYGVSGKTYGNRGGVHCKMATRADRRRPATGFAMTVGTINTCSSKCGNWPGRKALAAARVKALGVGGRLADIVAVQEGSLATDTFDKDLKPEFDQGCQVAHKNAGVAEDDDQSLYVRTDYYDIDKTTEGGFQFKDHGQQGACWVQVVNKSTGRRVVVVSVHLTDPSHATPAVRRAQLNEVVTRVNAASGSLPKVFAGDFNSRNSHTSRSYDIARTTMWSRGRYDDSFDVANSIQCKPYYNSGGAHTSTPEVSWSWNDHIDKVYAPPGVHVAAWKVDYLMSGGHYVQRFSDHNPVVAQLVFPG